MLAIHSNQRAPLYRRVAPSNVDTKTARPQPYGAAENSGTRTLLAAPFDGVAVVVGLPEPAEAVAVVSTPTSMEPPWSPGPLPAPFLKYWLAWGGMAGRVSLPTSQVLDAAGQLLACPPDCL